MEVIDIIITIWVVFAIPYTFYNLCSVYRKKRRRDFLDKYARIASTRVLHRDACKYLEVYKVYPNHDWIQKRAEQYFHVAKKYA